MTDSFNTPQPYIYVAARPLTVDEIGRFSLVPAPSGLSAAGHTCSPGSCGCGETEPPSPVS
jgi:hypothetical protein